VTLEADMHYPWWYVPFLTSPMLIAFIAVIHVYVSMYAVGGGLFLAVETSYAYRIASDRYLSYLKEHTWFFILVTVVFGAITGVGIWWTIGLASPLATETLIHIFVFGWAMEYVFFVLEIVSAFIFFYSWGKLPPRTHQAIGWIYGVSAWASLVLITGITAFMLNPGGWLDNPNFWVAFFNPQLLPQTVARTGGALLLASLYVYLHAAFFRADDPDLRRMISTRSTRPGLLGAALVTVGGVWWYLALPPSAQAALAAASALNILMVIIFAVTVVVFVMLYLGPYRNPAWITPGFALLLFTFGLAAIGAGEFVREAVRKPYVVYGVVLSNQILPEEVDRFRQVGLLESGVWTRAVVAERYPASFKSDGTLDESSLLDLPRTDRRQLGEVIFSFACNDCHSSGAGYSTVSELMRGWSPEMIRAVVDHPERTQFFMPPFAGTGEEAELLTEYLTSIARPFPPGLVDGGG
jgi:cytochrome bd-type quinol oxidase subunit 1